MQRLRLRDGNLNSQVIYDAINDDETFGQLSGVISEFINARSSTFATVRNINDADIISSHYLTDDLLEEFVNEFSQFDPWTKKSFNFIEQTLPGEHYITPDLFEKSILYNEFFKRKAEDTFYAIGGVYDVNAEMRVFGFHRARSAGPFSPEETARLRHVIPHLKTAISVRERVAGQGRSLKIAKSLLDAIAVAALVVTRDGRLIDLNAPAERILKAEDGLTLRQGTVRSEGGGLGAAIRLATAPATPMATPLALPRASSPLPRLASVVPLQDGLAAILCQDEAPMKPQLDMMLRDLFALTPSEAAVAMLLHAGLTKEEIEARRGVTGNTLRTQVKALMSKMGCRRQSEVMATVARLSVWTGAGASSTQSI